MISTRSQPTDTKVSIDTATSVEHRISCHRCGNIRKRRTICSRANCPHTFCGRCTDKLKVEYGNEVFLGGCPVCKDLCCCSNKTVNCSRKYHCYRKCPATKSGKLVNSPKESTDCTTDESVTYEDGKLSSCQPCVFQGVAEMHLSKKQRLSSDFRHSISERNSIDASHPVMELLPRSISSSDQTDVELPYPSNAPSIPCSSGKFSFVPAHYLPTNKSSKPSLDLIPVLPYYFPCFQSQGLSTRVKDDAVFDAPSGISLLAAVSSYDYYLHHGE
jgi:hypothetical protein